MPDRQSKEYLEIKKRFALTERNMLSALQNINILTMEIERTRAELERVRNIIASKEGFEDLLEDLADPRMVSQQQAQQQSQQQSQQTTTTSRRGPMSAKQGRTLKVINN